MALFFSADDILVVVDVEDEEAPEVGGALVVGVALAEQVATVRAPVDVEGAPEVALVTVEVPEVALMMAEAPEVAGMKVEAPEMEAEAPKMGAEAPGVAPVEEEAEEGVE